MQRTILTPVTLLALGAMTLGGCSAFENFGGQKKVSPDEFKIVSHSPLTMPPNADLRPPRPGFVAGALIGIRMSVASSMRWKRSMSSLLTSDG